VTRGEVSKQECYQENSGSDRRSPSSGKGREFKRLLSHIESGRGQKTGAILSRLRFVGTSGEAGRRAEYSYYLAGTRGEIGDWRFTLAP